MNVANLQLEGLLIAVASINCLLVERGVISVAEVDTALRKAEANAVGDDRVSEDLSPSNRDAICFPIRFLQMANNAQGDGYLPTFSELARMVGQTKEPHNDQM